MRRVRLRVATVAYQSLTNVTAPRTVPLRAIAHVSQRRWASALAVTLITQPLGLHLLGGAEGAVVLRQVWGVLSISQMLQALRLERAQQAGGDPGDVSLPVLGEWAPRLLAQGQHPVAGFVRQGRAVRVSRPATRTATRAPDSPADQRAAAPPDRLRVRLARYAGRRSPSDYGLPAHTAQ